MTVALLFPGQGSQYQGMADPWLEDKAGKKVLDKASKALGWDVVERSRDPEALQRTDVVQPAIFACDLAAHAVLSTHGIPWAAAAGHSLGEYAALVASGAVAFKPALAALVVRADSMQLASEQNPGGMTALIGLTSQEALEVCAVAGRVDVLTVANENGARQIVLSGTLSAIDRAEDLARTRGAKAIRLPVAGAFHSPLMEPAVQPVRQAISRMDFSQPQFPIVPNGTGDPTSSPLVLRDLLSRHLTSPVRWEASMRSMGEMGITWFVEAGPGDVLGKLARRAVPDAEVRSAGSPSEAAAVAEELRQRAVVPETGEAS